MDFLVAGPIDVEALEESARRTEPGAVISFQGVVRPDRTPRGDVAALEFSAYDAMAEEEMERVLAEVRTRWPDAHALCRHRLGRVPVGETSLFLVLSAPETAQAFQACHFTLEQMRDPRADLEKRRVRGRFRLLVRLAPRDAPDLGQRVVLPALVTAWILFDGTRGFSLVPGGDGRRPCVGTASGARWREKI
jgi:molybdopterin synthase catalytic subunit